MSIRSRLGAWLRRGLGQAQVGEPAPILVQAGQDEVATTPTSVRPAVSLPWAEIVETRARYRRDWLGNLEYPADPDAEPEWLAIEDEYLARRGLPAYPWRTRRKLEAAIAACERRLTVTAKVSSLAPALPAHEAARRFLSWLRETGKCGRYTNESLREAYEAHCHECRIVPSSDAHVRKHLAQLGGVSKALDNIQSGPRRERPTIWTIKSALAVSVAVERLAA